MDFNNKRLRSKLTPQMLDTSKPATIIHTSHWGNAI
jgi:hypothetical protein